MRFINWLRRLFNTIEKHFDDPPAGACPYCGDTWVCLDCGRCFKPSCNAGCIYCRKGKP